jgi:hypothetical protein
MESTTQGAPQRRPWANMFNAYGVVGTYPILPQAVHQEQSR